MIKMLSNVHKTLFHNGKQTTHPPTKNM